MTPRGTCVSWTPDDVVRYHLALGAGTSLDDHELAYVDERRVVPLPTFSVVPAAEAAAPVAYDPALGVDLSRIVQVGQALEVHEPLPSTATVKQRAVLEACTDTGRGVLLAVRVDASTTDDRPLCTNRFTLLAPVGDRAQARGGGSASPPRASGAGRRQSPLEPVPDRAPDTVLDLVTLPQQALLYRSVGDRHPIHLDPTVARAAGFERPILQGLCTWGMTCKALVDHVLDGDATRVAAFRARFAAPVYPGDSLRLSAWRTAEGVLFSATVPERDAVALRDGALLVRNTTPTGG